MSITSTEKKRRVIMFGLLGTALAVVLLLVSFALFSPDKPSTTSTMVAARSDAVTGQNEEEASCEYNDKR